MLEFVYQFVKDRVFTYVKYNIQLNFVFNEFLPFSACSNLDIREIKYAFA